MLVACSHSATKESIDPSSAEAMNQTIEWRIEAGRVGPVEIGRPLPEAMLVEDLGSHYLARLIADGQPIDAFTFEVPPLMIVVIGPYTTANDTDEDATG